MKTLSLSVLVLVVFFGCGAPEGPLEEASSAIVLTPLDSVGIELGDERFVFGVIASVEFLPDGRLLVLDSNRQTLRVFSAFGEFLSEYGGPGDGPGELLSSRDMAVLGSGVIVITDPRAGEFELFHPDTGHAGTLMGFTPRAPFTIDACGELVVGHQGLFNREQGTNGEALAGWKLDSPSPAVVFFEEWSRFDPEQMAARFMEPDPPIEVMDSTVYYSPLASESYEILAFDLNGNSQASLTRPDYSPVPKTPEELEVEMELYEQRRQQMLGMGRGGPAMAGGEYSPSEFHFAVTSLGVDSEGRLWARRGHGGQPVFDLFDITTGEWLGTASGPLHMGPWTFVVTPYGIAAFEEDPPDYPRILLLGF
ncbi:MAG: 6-bladed beta-propeller [Candidatus Fermentibacteraceae bacterium]